MMGAKTLSAGMALLWGGIGCPLGTLACIMREGFATSFFEARPARARRATRVLPTADGGSLSRIREGACPPPLRADGNVTPRPRT